MAITNFKKTSSSGPAEKTMLDKALADLRNLYQLLHHIPCVSSVSWVILEPEQKRRCGIIVAMRKADAHHETRVPEKLGDWPVFVEYM